MSSTLQTNEAISRVPNAQAWSALSRAIRNYRPEVVVLVARKMPRLLEALELDFGSDVLCVSDQAIPFSVAALRNARVAIVDDVWNYGSTMQRALGRVRKAQPRMVQMFALGAKDAESARIAGVKLVIPNSLSLKQYQSIVDSVPQSLSLIPKPYDADFPIIPCLLTSAFADWRACWAWLRATFGENVHSTTNEAQATAGFTRATISLGKLDSWTIKARLYFDLIAGTCNVVPMALAPELPLKNDYPVGTLAADMFDILDAVLLAQGNPLHDDRDGRARANTFCDGLLFADRLLASLKGFLYRESLAPFSIPDFHMQFGEQAAYECRDLSLRDFATPHQQNLPVRHAVDEPRAACGSLLANPIVSDRARKYLAEGSPVMAMDALFQDLGIAVGANNPAEYRLAVPYTLAQIEKEPYLRLRLGFGYQEIIEFFAAYLISDRTQTAQSADQLVSALIDLFIDRGAIVPTFTLDGDCCRRIYRKGEANPPWEDAVARLMYTLDTYPADERRDLIEKHRTRVAKILAIMAFAGRAGDSVAPGSLERGTVGMLTSSGIEARGEELTGLIRRMGRWK